MTEPWMGYLRAKLGAALAATMLISAGAGWCAAAQDAPRLSRDGKTISWQAKEYMPIDDAGVYYYEADSVSGIPMPSPRDPLNEILSRHGFHGMLRCDLVDYVDCTRTDHNFIDDGRSRVLELPDGEKYRLTAGDGELSWYAYVLKTRPRPGRPHVIVVQTINDVERYTTVTLTVPKGKPWAAPYSGEETASIDCQEPNCYNPDVGGTVYTGREYPLDRKSFDYMFLYYPKAGEVKVTISHQASEEKHSEINGAAVARIWLFDIIDPISEVLVEPAVPPDGPERKLALYVPHPWFIYSHYGTPYRTKEQRIQGLTSFVEYVKFCGFNQLQLHIINGSDTAGRAWYDSKLYKPFEADLIEELIPMAAESGIQVLPIVTPIFAPYGSNVGDYPVTPDENGFCRLSLQLDRDGKTYTSTMGSLAPDPLRPEVQEWLFKCLREILDRAAKYRNVPGVGFRVNGKIGLCYVGNQPNKCGQDSGYSEWDISEFENDTGVKVPRVGVTAYDWLRANAWEKWIAWRCRRTHDFWLKARDLVRSYRPGMKLVVACDLPSEYPGYNIEWVNGTAPRELMRHHGYDPELFKNDDGIVIQRGMMIASDRYFGKWGPPHGRNAWAHKAFNYADGVVECYETPSGHAVELYYNYWEEVPHPDPQYGTNLRTAAPAPPGQFYFEPATYSIRKANVHTMAFMGWERASIGHEHDLRRFARAYRALPAVAPKDFEGQVKVLNVAPGAKYRKPEDPDVWVKWFGSRLAVLNDTGSRKYVSITIPKPLPKGSCLFDLGAGRILRQTDKPLPKVEVKLVLQEHDLYALAILPLAQARNLAAKATSPSPAEGPGQLRLKIEGDIYGGQEAVVRFSLLNTGTSTLSDAEIDVDLPRSWELLPGADGEMPGLPIIRRVSRISPGKSADFAVRVRIPLNDIGNVFWVTGTAVYHSAGKEFTEQRSVVTSPMPPIELTVTPDHFTDKTAGEAASIMVSLRNMIALAVKADLNFQLPQGWQLLSDTSRLRAGPHGSTSHKFTIVIPPGTMPGKYVVKVTADTGEYVTPPAECTFDVPQSTDEAENP